MDPFSVHLSERKQQAKTKQCSSVKRICIYPHATCRETMSCEEGSSFFGQLLHGLLHNLQPVQVPGQPHLQSSPLREACKEVLAATCQLLGPEAFLQQVLGSVPGLGSHSASLDPKPLEVCTFIAASSNSPQSVKHLLSLQYHPSHAPFKALCSIMVGMRRWQHA